MFGKIQMDVTREQLDSLKRRYRLFGKSDDEVCQIVFDGITSKPGYHTKNLPKNRTQK